MDLAEQMTSARVTCARTVTLLGQELIARYGLALSESIYFSYPSVERWMSARKACSTRRSIEYCFLHG